MPTVPTPVEDAPGPPNRNAEKDRAFTNVRSIQPLAQGEGGVLAALPHPERPDLVIRASLLPCVR